MKIAILTDEDRSGLQELIELIEMIGLPLAAERRRYALLQATAVIYATPCGDGSFHTRYSSAVDEAEAILADIESRELDRQKAGGK